MKIVALIGLLLGITSLILFFWERKKYGKSALLTAMPLTGYSLWAIRLFVGGLFIFSGFVKANDYIGFSYKLEEYFEVFTEYTPFLKGFWTFWMHNALPLAWGIAVFELGLAMAILVGWRMNLTMWLTMLMMVFFTFLTGFSAITNTVTDCGCFGDAIKLKPVESFMKDIILLIVLTPLFIFRKEIKAFPNTAIAFALTMLMSVGSAGYAYYCHEFLPRVDYLPYSLDKDLRICTTEIVDGAPKCKDWDEIVRIGKDFEVLEGKTLVIVMYDMDKAPELALRKSAVLANTLTQTDSTVRVIGMTATGKSAVEAMMRTYSLPYPISFRDRTMLKTIIRSNPGYVLLQDGVVRGKWHHNSTPSSQEILELLK